MIKIDKFKNILIGMISAMLALTSIPVCAASYTEDGTAECTVSATVNSSYTVSLPATVTLSKNEDKYEGTYTAGVKGNILSTQKVTIVPDESFTLTGTDSGATATATVTQEKTTWTKTGGSGNLAIGSSSYSNTSGKVEVELSTADSYSGHFDFTFELGDI